MYIEKDASINEDIESLRLRATSSLMEREDVVIVATVSAIYGLGDPVEYRKLMVTVTRGEQRGRDEVLAELVRIQYGRNDVAFERGTFRVRGDSVEIFPAYEEQAIRIELWGDEVERISKINPLTGDTIAQLDQCAIYPAKHFVTERPTIERAVQLIRAELAERLLELRSAGKLLEAQRLESPHQVRHRDDARGRHLRRHRELLPAPERAVGRASGPPACSTTSRRISWWWWTSRTSRCPRSAGCSTATGRASSPWSSTASGCPPRWTTGRCSSTSS